MVRPSKYDTIDLKQLEILASKGFTQDEIAKFFKICLATLKNYKNKYAEFLATIKRGQKISDTKVEKSLYERAIGYTHPEEKIFNSYGKIIRADTLKHYPPDPVSMIFWLKNRKPKVWRDKQEIGLDDDTINKIIRLPGKKPVGADVDDSND